MKELEIFLEGFNISEKRSVLYYLARFLKQADTFEDYKKNIFDDGPDSEPSEEIKSVTLEIISFIETTAQKRISEFDDDKYFFWMDKIAEIEDKIDDEPDAERVRKAMDELGKFDVPTIKSTKNS